MTKVWRRYDEGMPQVQRNFDRLVTPTWNTSCRFATAQLKYRRHTFVIPSSDFHWTQGDSRLKWRMRCYSSFQTLSSIFCCLLRSCILLVTLVCVWCRTFGWVMPGSCRHHTVVIPLTIFHRTFVMLMSFRCRTLMRLCRDSLRQTACNDCIAFPRMRAPFAKRT